MKKSILTLAMAGICATGCATHNATTLVKALGHDPAGFSLHIDTLYGKIHLVRANPGSNTPPYMLSADGTVRVLETTQGAAPATTATRDEVLLQAIKRIPPQPQVQ